MLPAIEVNLFLLKRTADGWVMSAWEKQEMFNQDMLDTGYNSENS